MHIVLATRLCRLGRLEDPFERVPMGVLYFAFPTFKLSEVQGVQALPSGLELFSVRDPALKFGQQNVSRIDGVPVGAQDGVNSS